MLDYRSIHHSGDMKRFPAIFLKFLCTLLPWLAELSAESAQQQTLMSRLLLHDSLPLPDGISRMCCRCAMIIGDATKRRQDRLDLEKRRKQKSLKSGSALPSPPEDFLDDHHLKSEDVDDDLDSDDDSNDDEDDSDDELTHWVIPQVKRLLNSCF